MAASDTRARRPAAGRGGRAAGRGRQQASGRKGRKRGGPERPSVANHPRGGTQVKQAKGWAGLIGFALVAFVSYESSVPTEDLILRALAGGIVAYLVVWAIAVAVWRHLVVSELDIKREERAEAERERRAAIQAATAAAAQGEKAAEA
ncbi:hypothetical protein Q5424_17070 [Conexibacter sp. JD483]|uniref:hypothetical protein n=1 Tax=unclassified Conexibacter TaxID=2627773 RepID=UPI0027259F92|nr:MULTISPECIES: hypothetical protein [unclassified Conexibacter]MDO8188223.1 hypothetical protein [Conexibacter sp. CPCC 205706]MDO8201813.1 hypothetical protein [Conexibacter sp. CPCC 205762]MDR9370811.1 hypothetical protein [Conexibacter sp. JD483]